MRRQSGDTIVEVMIAIMVISAVLTGAFLVSRASIKNVRDSEEHAQALKLVQGQLELLRTAAATHPQSHFTGTFCMAGTPPDVTTGPTCTTGLYTLSVKEDTTFNTYQATAKWDSVNGGQAQVQLSYRVRFAP